MARERIILLLALGVLGALAPRAAAKSFAVPDRPNGVFYAGSPVTLDAAVASETVGPLAHVHPVVIARPYGSDEVVRFRATRATDSSGSTTLRAVFPSAGAWRLRVTVPGRHVMYEGQTTIVIHPARHGSGTAVAPASGGGDGGPSALVWILSVIAILTPFAIWAIWRRRPAAT